MSVSLVLKNFAATRKRLSLGEISFLIHFRVFWVIFGVNFWRVSLPICVRVSVHWLFGAQTQDIDFGPSRCKYFETSPITPPHSLTFTLSVSHFHPLTLSLSLSLSLSASHFLTFIAACILSLTTLSRSLSLSHSLALSLSSSCRVVLRRHVCNVPVKSGKLFSLP